MSTEKKSHEAHSGWFDLQYATQGSRNAAIERWISERKEGTINNWIHQRQLELTVPFTKAPKSWLTVGDGYGFDANYFYDQGLDVMATDISGTFLSLSKSYGVLENYSIENAEQLSFGDESFDYIFCKEAFHHFPRPYMAVYEMLRVAREAVILVEPHDPISKMPLLLAMRNLLDRHNPNTLQKYWKNRYSFEAVGNYVFKLSEREMDKLANGIGLPAVAFKGINNDYYDASTSKEKADDSSAAFRKIKRKLAFDNLLVKLSLMPSQVLCAVVFKKLPTQEVQESMKREGFIFHVLPPNPYAQQ